MPAKSQAQRGYLFAHFGPAWVKAHHFDNSGKLPARVQSGNRTTTSVAARRKVDMGRRKKKRSDLDAIIQRLRA